MAGLQLLEGKDMQMPQMMRRCRRFAAAAAVGLTCIGLAACSSLGARPVTPISTIINAAADGMSSESLVSRIRSGKTTYAVRGSDFARLAERRVPDPVLDVLQQDFFARVEALTRLWYMRRDTGGPTSTFPQPLDLDNLEQGGNGMASTIGISRVAHGTRPPGVPEWVPQYPPLSGGVITPDAVLEMTSSGQSTQQIVETVENSRIWPMYTDNTNPFSWSRTAALTGSKFAELARQGVAPEVLDALQATYFAAHVESTRMSTPVP
jgi:hypothetical protein